MNNLSQHSQSETTRRGLLAGNLKAIAFIAAGALVTRITPAKAEDRDYGGYGRHDGGDDGGRWGRGGDDDDGRRGHDRGDDGGHEGHHEGGHGGGNCFLRGTKIRTVEGERAIETLEVGDLLPTVFGGVRPIQWIERFRRSRVDASKPWQNHARPVRIMKSALAPNVPQADLFLTPGHALLLDGVLVTASSLINGTTIALYDAEEYDELEFFQIKLETHDVIFAEGAASETLLRMDETAIDYPAYVDKFGPVTTRDAYCAPVFGNGARSEIGWRMHSAMSRWIGPHKVDIIRERLEDRARVAVLGR
jgi:Hint domain